ncbi:energy-coupling factor transport system substrate-specific component [Microbacterium ginsengiterrae]|uniref:Energy-coupling factor transport system substrate-specific component n=1 Tax=Microbacterium ginsengiterrae TaxID=546115 RepID=A0A7W9FD98_9MICO|nr:ECF transporter S component [Microbacterium paludicola]MBB5743054.1 energy-coupling factor transport system substrate-specific component [Microbacterium ginsengiterrae]
MPKNRVLATRTLLVCAAVGVATGLVSAGWAGLHIIAASGAIPLYGLVLGFHVLPGVIAQQVLRAPWVALITHAIAALIGIAFVPAMAGRYLLAAVVFGGVQEAVSAATRYRHWEPWRFFLSSAITGLVIAVPLWFAFHVSSLPLWGAIGFGVLFVIGPVAWTVIGLAIGSALRRAGVIRV